ncbi:MAG: hypothetical protein IJ120_02660 [Solobacterium sp.]|nr:hypothetical protein [Solobacterium sp.]
MADMWDNTLPEETEQEHIVLKPGTYTFQVVTATGKIYEPKPTSRIGRCAQIDLRLRCESDRDVTVFDSLYADPSTAWKLTAFAKCIGVYHQNMTPRELLKECEGGIGQVNLIVEEYNGKKRNRVKQYIPAVVAPDDLPF